VMYGRAEEQAGDVGEGVVSGKEGSPLSRGGRFRRKWDSFLGWEGGIQVSRRAQ